LRTIALLALATIVLALVANVTTGAPGALILFVLLVPAFLCELIADLHLLGWKSSSPLAVVSELFLSSLFERPPPFSLA
jgi:hypothetical protein